MNSVIYLMLALLINPFMGAALRNWQGCCLQFSATVALYLLPFLALGFSARLVPWFAKRPLLRSVASWSCLVLWCLGAPFSCLHALS